MYCQNCGKQIEPGQVFCSGCGVPVVQKNVEVSVAQSNLVDDQQQTIQLQQSVQPEQKPLPMPDVQLRRERQSEQKPLPMPNVQPKAGIQQSKSTTAQTQPKKKAKRSKKTIENNKKKPVGMIILSVLLSIVLFLLVTVLVALVGVKNFNSRENIKRIVDNVDLADLDISGIAGERNQDLEEFIYDMANESMPGSLTKEELHRILKSSKTRRYITKIVGDSFDYILTGTGKIRIKSDDIIDLINASGIELSEEEMEQIKIEMEYNDIDRLNIADVIDENMPFLDKIHIFDPTVLLYVLAAVIALIVIGMFAINFSYIEKSFLDVGVPTFLSGFIIWILMLFSSQLQHAFASGSVIPSQIVDLLIDGIAAELSGIAVIPMQIGAVSFLLFLLIRGVGVLRRRIASKTL